MKLLKRSCVLVVALSAMLGALHGCEKTEASPAALVASRYVQVFTDPEFGCEYITTMDGGITPRKNKAGDHVGCKR